MVGPPVSYTQVEHQREELSRPSRRYLCEPGKRKERKEWEWEDRGGRERRDGKEGVKELGFSGKHRSDRRTEDFEGPGRRTSPPSFSQQGGATWSSVERIPENDPVSLTRGLQ